MDGQIEERGDGRMDEWIDRQMNRWIDGQIEGWVVEWMSAWIHEEREKKGKEKWGEERGRGKRRGEERKADNFVTFMVNLGLSPFIDLPQPIQFPPSQQYFPPIISTIVSTLNSVLGVAIFRTHQWFEFTNPVV